MNSGQLCPDNLGRLHEVAQLVASGRPREVLHPAVGSRYESIRGHVTETLANALGNGVDSLDGVAAEIDDSEHDAFFRQVGEDAEVDLGLCCLDRNLLCRAIG